MYSSKIIVYSIIVFVIIFGVTICALTDSRKTSDRTWVVFVFLQVGLLVVICDIFADFHETLFPDFFADGNVDFCMQRWVSSLLALLCYRWTIVINRLSQQSYYKKMLCAARFYIGSYIAFWLISSLLILRRGFLFEEPFLICTDGGMVLLLIGSGTVYTAKMIQMREEKLHIKFAGSGTFFLVFNMIICHHEALYNSGFLHANYKSLDDLRLLGWLCLFSFTVYYSYKVLYLESMKSEIMPPRDERADIEKEKWLAEEKRIEELARNFLLTGRETQLVRMICEGKSNLVISKELFIAESTVKTHIYRIFRKLKVRSRSEIIRAVRNGGTEAPVLKDENG